MRRIGSSAVLSAVLATAAWGQSGRGPSGRWVGQDGHDFVGPNSALAPSDIEDIHIELAGLPESPIVRAVIRPLGGGEYQFGGPHGPWKAHILQQKASTKADVYLEPDRAETGRPYSFELTFENGQRVQFDVKGGRADPGKRKAGASMTAAWKGQGADDEVGPTPNVGPDGLVDARIELKRLSPQRELHSIRIESGRGGAVWESGVNPAARPTAELLRDPKDPATGYLLFQPTTDLAGKVLTLTATYAGGAVDRTTLRAGRVDPKARVVDKSLPRASELALSSEWQGQGFELPDGLDGHGVAVRLNKLPQETWVAAVLTDRVGGVWSWKANESVSLEGIGDAKPLVVQRSRVPGQVTLGFEPIRDESNAPLSLRLIQSDGSTRIATIEGGAADPLRRVPHPTGPERAITPSDDLHSAVSASCILRLAEGIYRLTRPLELSKPIQLIGQRGTVLEFAQPPGAEPWSAALKIHTGGVALESLAVRFAGPVRWKSDVSFGPAVIGSTDNTDPPHRNPIINLTFRGLDLDSPPASTPWEEAPRLIRIASGQGGRIENCKLRGGIIELFRGPWTVVGNTYRGTPQNTYTYAVISAHDTRDLIVERNTIAPEPGSGKTWRFLVLTGSCFETRVASNTVSGIGPRDLDKLENANAPEIILTENYTVRFEGRPRRVGAGGRLVALSQEQGEPIRPGDVLAILTGKGAGSYRRVDHVIAPAVIWLDSAIPSDASAVSVAGGLVNTVIRENTVDSRGSTAAANLVLVGNLFGLDVIENHLLGAGEAFKITAAPTERPRHWGWTHAPCFGARIEGNRIEDAARGARFAVEHSQAIKSNSGRVYGSGIVRGNSLVWSESFAARSRRSKEMVPPGLVLGDSGGHDPGELVVTLESNTANGPRGARVHSATIDGTKVENRTIPWPRDGEKTARGASKGTQP